MFSTLFCRAVIITKDSVAVASDHEDHVIEGDVTSRWVSRDTPLEDGTQPMDLVDQEEEEVYLEKSVLDTVTEGVTEGIIDIVSKILELPDQFQFNILWYGSGLWNYNTF